jgi:hypothetical protein
VTVRVDVVAGGLMVVGEKLRVRPVGGVPLKLTGLLNPLTGLIVIVDGWEPPTVIVNEAGLADTVKSGPTTATVTVVVLYWYPLVVMLVPNMSTVYEPGIVELTLNVAVDPLATVVAVIDAFKFLGDETLRSTDPEKPLVGTTVMVELWELPALTVNVLGLAVR